MLYVDKLLNTPFRVLARMVDTLACRRVEMLLAETLQVPLSLFLTLMPDTVQNRLHNSFILWNIKANFMGEIFDG